MSAARVIFRTAWTLVAAWLLLATALGASSFAQDYPALTGRVVDQANLLPPDAEAALDGRLAAHEAKTGEQVVVATVSSLGGDTIEEYGVRLGRHWGIGAAGEDNGALLIVAPNEREVRIEVGYGLEGKITDALASQIVNNEILPRFRTGDLAGGIAAGADAMLAILEGTYVPGEWSLPGDATGAREEMPVPEWVIPLLFFGAWMVFVLVVRRGRRRSPWIMGPGLGGLGRRPRGGFSGGGFSRGGFSGRGGSFGGGGASGRW